MYKGPKHYFGNIPLWNPHSLTQEEAEKAAAKDQKDAKSRLLIDTELCYDSDYNGNYVRAMEVHK